MTSFFPRVQDLPRALLPTATAETLDVLQRSWDNRRSIGAAWRHNRSLDSNENRRNGVGLVLHFTVQPSN